MKNEKNASYVVDFNNVSTNGLESSPVKESLARGGIECSSEELDKTISRLERLGFIKPKNEGPAELYLLTALGQAVSENPKK